MKILDFRFRVNDNKTHFQLLCDFIKLGMSGMQIGAIMASTTLVMTPLPPCRDIADRMHANFCIMRWNGSTLLYIFLSVAADFTQGTCGRFGNWNLQRTSVDSRNSIITPRWRALWPEDPRQ